MCQPLAMDRLVCGDVGFGKTEVAMRAAFGGGKQQAGGGAGADYPPRPAALRQLPRPLRQLAGTHRDAVAFSQRQRADADPEQASEGKIDILIGTHKLLQSDVKWKDLGLLIVDEEHRFGVRHKERIKAMRADVDILTLTATPIRAP